MTESIFNKNDVSGVDLLHPQMLSNEQMCSLFEKWHIPSELYKSLEEEKLLDLYNQTLMPFPQRRYKKNRRGKLLNAQRKTLLQNEEKCTSKSPHTMSNSESSGKIKLSGSSSSSKLSRDSDSSLKSPKSSHSSSSKRSYSPITFDKKGSSKSVNGIDGISHSRKTESEGADSKRSKIIRLINDTITGNKRDSSTSKSSSSHSSKSRDREHRRHEEKHRHHSRDESPPKKKHKPITWP